ncbi:hypothetical protein EC9_29580 [Rosistilla ulvae]|uniref:Uncharacterized protein n=1 Tax=Rosistilla ulvae TaxID=1930277 RepID=A0A517M1K6_9BACT|nr:hypothetical protein EC9_29580 [Rosistilla ulvae]
MTRKKKKKLSAQQMAICHNCSLSISWRENHVVRPEVWAAAGMLPSDGHLHRACLETRLRRKLELADILVMYVGENSEGIKMRVLDLEAYLEFNDAMGY